MRPRSFTDDELLDTARRVFLEHGAGASTEQIAQELGVSQAALFKRVGTKQELMVRSLMPRSMPWIEELESGPDDRPVREQLHELGRKITAFLHEQMPCIAVLWAAGIKPSAFKLGVGECHPGKRAHQALRRWFSKLAEQGRIHAPSPAAVASAFNASLQVPLFMKNALGPNAPVVGDDYHEQVIELFWRGIDPRNAHPGEHA